MLTLEVVVKSLSFGLRIETCENKHQIICLSDVYSFLLRIEEFIRLLPLLGQ